MPLPRRRNRSTEQPGSGQALRTRAEALARERASQAPEKLEALAAEGLQRTLHELRVHQIELEIQNEELRRTQEEVEASRVQYFDLYDLAPVGYFTLNQDGLILEANLTAAKLLGVARGGLVNQPLSRFVLPEDQDANYLHFKQLFKTGQPLEWEMRLVRKAAAPLWTCVEATSVHDADATPVCRAVVSDITRQIGERQELKRTVGQLESALTEKTVLLKEVHHRVKNNLAVISSLLNMQTDTHGSAEVKAALAQSQRRVRSMALIHEHLCGNDHLDRVDFSEYARQLVREMYAAFVGEPGRISLDLAIDPIELGLDRAVPCALILNELMSNAFKHAFPGERKGEIRISFRESEQGQLELAIQDDGVGSSGVLGESRTKSLGLSIVRILTTQLDGTLEQEACAGTRFVLRFPAASLPAPNRPLPLVTG